MCVVRLVWLSVLGTGHRGLGAGYECRFSLLKAAPFFCVLLTVSHSQWSQVPGCRGLVCGYQLLVTDTNLVRIVAFWVGSLSIRAFPLFSWFVFSFDSRISGASRSCRHRLHCDNGFSRGVVVLRTYGTHKTLYIHPFLLTIFGPIYYGTPVLVDVATTTTTTKPAERWYCCLLKAGYLLLVTSHSCRLLVTRTG